MSKNKLQVLAFYLPQFHPVEENDKWWGKGFTEWTNVAKARPLFKGHNQPRIPADLGFYDLRVPEVREQQVELAREAGVTAFCYWHYWFGDGKRLLERVFDEVHESGTPDFPFCLGWANHSWYAKTWNKESKDTLLIEQTYSGYEDAKMHFNFLVKAFKDNRYVKIEDKPFLFIFDPRSLPHEYIDWFNQWAKEAGFPGLYLVANIKPYEDKNDYLNKGYSAVLFHRTIQYSRIEVAKDRFHARLKVLRDKYKFLDWVLKFRRTCLNHVSTSMPVIVDYGKYNVELITNEEYSEDVIPQIIPQWDHTPRSGKNGLVWVNSDPDKFYQHAKSAVIAVKHKKNPIIMLKSWNEWGEGNYMEPDTKYGHGYLSALHRAISDE